MSLVLPQFEVGNPMRHESLSVFPLFSDAGSNVEYRLSEDAFADKSLSVDEVSRSGSVSDLMVENRGAERVLFLEGEELVGAKQNRILNTSVLVGAASRICIPVSCVEQGRWSRVSPDLRTSGSHSPPKLRRALKASVTRSSLAQRGHQADQAAIWRQVASLDAAFRVDSSTLALSDAFAGFGHQIAETLGKLPYVPNASGLAVAIQKDVVCVDVFDKPATCERAWRRLLSGAVLELFTIVVASEPPTAPAVKQLLDRICALGYYQTPAVGDGEEYRSESESGDHATFLVFQSTVVHGSVSTFS